MHIDWLKSAQHESLISLLQEVYAHYSGGEIVSPQLIRDHLRDNLTASNAPIRIVTAVEGDDVIGFAAIGLLHSFVDPRPVHNKQCVMKELYVRQTERNRKIGRSLMEWVVDFATREGCGRIDWHVKTTNLEGIRFYEGLGASRVADRLSLRLPLG